VSVAEDSPRRGWVGAYVAAFVLLVAAGYSQARGNLDSSLKLVWASISFSGLAILSAAASVVLRPRTIRRRARRDPEPDPGPHEEQAEGR